jgi:hypothetical protein
MSSNTGENNQYELNYKKSTVVRSMTGSKTSQLTKLDNAHKITAVSFHHKKQLIKPMCSDMMTNEKITAEVILEIHKRYA